MFEEGTSQGSTNEVMIIRLPKTALEPSNGHRAARLDIDMKLDYHIFNSGLISSGLYWTWAQHEH